ncbi:hypothetical protein ACMZ4X_00559 [Achromobacter marplatensis]
MALDPRKLGRDAQHEMAAVGQGGQRVRGGEFAQFEFSALAIGNVGDEPVPHHPIVGVAPRTGGALPPPHALQRQADAEFQVPRCQRGGCFLQRRAISRQVLWMDALLDRGGAGAHVVRGQFKHVPDACTDIREPGAALGHRPTLEDQAGYRVGEVDDEVRRALEPLRHGAHRADIGSRPHHPQRPPRVVSANYFAAAADPLVAAVLATDAVLHFIAFGLAVEMVLHGGAHVVKVVRMQARVGVLDARGELRFAIPQQGLPAGRISDLARHHVTVPDTRATTRDGQRQLLGFVAPGVFVGTFATQRRVRFDSRGREASQVRQGQAVCVGKIARLPVQQPQAA